MARVTIPEVRNILTRSGLSDMAIFAQIENANILVDSIVKPNLSSETLLKRIELFITAHFAVIDEERGTLVSESWDGTSDRYIGVEVGAAGLNATRYGKQAIMFDSSGTLARLGMKRASLKTFPRELDKHPNRLGGPTTESIG